MEWWQIPLIILGLALDDFIVMMGKGATLKDLTVGDCLKYSVIYGVVNVLAVSVGYLCAYLFKNLLNARLNSMIAVLILFAIGVYFLAKSLRMQKIEERLDLSFNSRKCLRLALLTCLGTVFMSITAGLIKMAFLHVALWAFGICTGCVYLALNVGYRYGYRYEKGIETVGSLTLIIMSVRLGLKFLV